MNKRGSAIFFVFMMGVVFFVVGLALAPVLKEVTDESMSSGQLDCNNESISDQQKAICTSTDMQQFLFTATLFGLAGMLLGGIAYG